MNIDRDRIHISSRSYLANLNILLSLFFAILFSTDGAILKQKSLSDIFNEDENNGKDSPGSGKNNVQSKPAFLVTHGTEGINYDMDNYSRPYVLCEFDNVKICNPASKDCPRMKKCYQSANGHRLGCMAVLVNSSFSQQDTLKDCWSHDGDLGNCASSKCVADERTAGKGNAALFCCCNTHNCNREVHFPPRKAATTLVTAVEPVEIENSVPFSSDKWVVAIVALGLIAGFLLIVLCFWAYKEFKNNQLYKAKAADAFSLSTVGDAKAPLIGCAKNDIFRDVTNLELVASGRFGKVSRGLLNNVPVAVKVFPSLDVNSWIVEQEIYALPSLRKHENILHYIGAEVHGADYWLLTEFHDNGSLFDFIKYRVLNLREALKVAASMLRGLSFLHEEKIVNSHLKPCIVHRDFKSRNVLLKSDLTAVIADFGLALKCENGQMPADDNHGQVGTRRYMPPEVLEGATEFTAFAFRQIDVYAAALVLWEVLSRTKINEADVVEKYQRPYEAEVGSEPILHDLRRVVAVQKVRPQMRPFVVEHNISGVLWKTTQDMWDMEPDGRITSGCAYERANTLYLSYANGSNRRDELHKQSNSSLNTPPPPYSHNDNVLAPHALPFKTKSPVSNGFRMDKCNGQVHSISPILKCTSDDIDFKFSAEPINLSTSVINSVITTASQDLS